MPIDPSIALGFQMPKLMSPMEVQGNALSLRALQQQTMLRQQEIQQGQQTLKDQQELSGIAADRSNLDPATGGLTADALAKISNPMLRQKLNQDRLNTMQKSAEIKRATSDESRKEDEYKQKIIHDIMEKSYGAGEDYLAKNPKLAQEKIQHTMKEQLDELAASGRGGFSKEQVDAIGAKWLPATPELLFKTITTHAQRTEEELKRRAAERGEETPFIKETNYLKTLEGKLADLAPTDPAAGALRKQIGELKAHITKLDAPARSAAPAAGPAMTKDQEKLNGEDFLKTLHPSEANQVRAVGEGRMLLSDLGVRGKARERIANLVTQAYPNFDSGDAKTNRAIEIDFARGKPAQSLQSINAVTEHLETYRNLAKALDNGDIQLYNKWKGKFEEATGKTLPANIEAAAPIIGSEVVKAIIPGGGGVGEREAAEKKWSLALSNKQVGSNIDSVFIPLMQGQVAGLRQRYEGSGKKDFDKRFLTPGARKSLNIRDGESGEHPKPASGAAPASAIEYLKANPGMKDAFKAKYGYLPEGM